MTPIEPLGAIAAVSAPTLQTSLTLGGASPASFTTNFGEVLAKGIVEVENKLETADAMVRKFALDDSIPIHQVTIALEEARLSVEMAVQFRNKLVEGYREIMNMQL